MNEHDIEVHEPEAGGERGASLVEYALLLALIAVVCILAVTTLGSNLSDSYDTTNESIFGP